MIKMNIYEERHLTMSLKHHVVGRCDPCCLRPLFDVQIETQTFFFFFF